MVLTIPTRRSIGAKQGRRIGGTNALTRSLKEHRKCGSSQTTPG
jgi:hypothetical protein